MDTMKQRVGNYIEEHGMIRPGDTVIAGVSGGADSLCLFLLLYELSAQMHFHLHVVHVHHGLRETAQEDLLFVQKLCKDREVPCTIVRVDAAGSAKQWGTGVEEAGRRLRYEAFRQVSSRLRREDSRQVSSNLHCEASRQVGNSLSFEPEGAEPQREGENSRCLIAVAHHREDQAETVLFHLCRGTDLRGARGMLPVNGQIIRPLLNESRASIEEYLTQRGFSWQEDETNADTGYTRNYIRREILPRLEEGVHAGAARRISQFAASCAEAEEYLAALTDRALLRCGTACAPGEALLIPEDLVCRKVLSLEALRQEDAYLQGRLLYRCLTDSTAEGKDIGTIHVDALRGLSDGDHDGRLSMPSRVTVIRSRGKLFFCRKKESDHPDAETGGLQESFPLSGQEYTCSVRDFDGSIRSIPRNEYTKWFDYDKIGTFPVFRTRQPGDCMRLFSDAPAQRDGRQDSDIRGALPQPAGLHSKESAEERSDSAGEKSRRLICKKIARIMLDGKVPAPIRDRIVLPFFGNEALWIPGLRMGDAFRVTASTTRILEIRWDSGRMFS